MDATKEKKVYAVFGASGGIGTSLVTRLAREGHTIYLLGRTPNSLKELSEKTLQPYKIVDGRDDISVEKTLSEIIAIEGKIDGVVSLIGSFHLKPLDQTTQKEFEEVIQTNLISSFCIVKNAAHFMSKQGKGSIVLSSSTAALIGLANHEAISAAKAGIVGLVRSSAASYAAKRIRINAIAPGLTRTTLSNPIISNELFLKASTGFHPLGRIGEPSDIADAIAWLLSEESSWITGQILAVDGGLSTIKTKPSV